MGLLSISGTLENAKGVGLLSLTLFFFFQMLPNNTDGAYRKQRATWLATLRNNEGL